MFEAWLSQAPRRCVCAVARGHARQVATSVLPQLHGPLLACMPWCRYKWDINVAVQYVEKEKVNIFNGVPTMSWELVHHPRLDSYDTSSLLAVGGGGAPTPPRLIGLVLSKFERAVPNQVCWACLFPLAQWWKETFSFFFDRFPHAYQRRLCLPQVRRHDREITGYLPNPLPIRAALALPTPLRFLQVRVTA